MPRTLSQRQPQSKAKSNSICSIDDNSDSSNSKRQLSIRAFCFQQSKKLKTPSTTPPIPASTSTPLNDEEKNDRPLSINNINNNKSETSSLPLKDHKEKKRKLAQVFLDCGQQNWGQVLCPKCGTLYVPGVAEDTKMHEQICKPINLGVIWSTGSSSSSNNNRKAKVLWCDNDKKNSILLIRPSEHSKYKAKLSQIQNIVQKDLGMMEVSSSIGHTTTTILLYLRQQRVVGFVSVLPVTTGYHLLTLYERDTKPIPCLLGVAVLWTHSSVRKQGIATKLVDEARAHAVFGMQVPKSKLAFSSPTEAGWTFAKQYVGKEQRPLVYEYKG